MNKHKASIVYAATLVACLALTDRAPVAEDRVPLPGHNNACDLPGEAPDLIVGDIPEALWWGTEGGITAFSIATISCNVGTCQGNWFGQAGKHPVIGQNMYRLMDGRFEQIGQSWLKHGFFALSDDYCTDNCFPTDGLHLGVGCSDTYNAFLNGRQEGLGPKFEINPSTGEFPYPATDLALTGNAIYKRLQVANADLDPGLNPRALYFVEAQYVARDEALAGNDENSVAWRRVEIDGSSGLYGMTLVDEVRGGPALAAWALNDPLVWSKKLSVQEDGLFYISARVRMIDATTYRYEYAVENTTSHRAARSFSVRIQEGVTISNPTFHDVPYHSGEPFDGTDWEVTIEDGAFITWSTDVYADNPDANALRWGTLYNFGFDADRPPVEGAAQLGLFKPGGHSGVGWSSAPVPGTGGTPGTRYRHR